MPSAAAATVERKTSNVAMAIAKPLPSVPTSWAAGMRQSVKAFTDCRIPAAQLVGTEGKGFAIAMATLDVFRSTVAAAALGMARRALDEALDYTAERNIYGGTLVELQLVQSKIGEMALGVDSSALMIYRAAWIHAAR